VEVVPIGEHVFPGWHRALGEDKALFARLPMAGRLPYRVLLNFVSIGAQKGPPIGVQKGPLWHAQNPPWSSVPEP